jgi:hypothetical protein
LETALCIFYGLRLTRQYNARLSLKVGVPPYIVEPVKCQVPDCYLTFCDHAEPQDATIRRAVLRPLEGVRV